MKITRSADALTEFKENMIAPKKTSFVKKQEKGNDVNPKKKTAGV